MKIVKKWAIDKKRELAFRKTGLMDYYHEMMTESMLLSNLPSWIMKEREHLVSRSTLVRNIGAVKNFMEIVGDLPCGSVDLPHIKEFIQARLKKGMQAEGINNDMRNLRSVWSVLRENNVVGSNPFSDHAKRIRLSTPVKELEVLSLDEIEQCFQHLDSPMIRDAFMIIRYTGCRRRSIAVKTGYWSNVLQWQEIDFKKGYIPIIQKGNHRKLIPLHPDLHSWLLKRFVELGNPTGNLITCYADTVTRKFKKAFLAAGITKKIDPVHGLRHTAATKLAEAGCTAADIQSILGWESIEMAQKYVHLSMERKRDVITNL
ncbi:site-specific integrase [bacterium]|nr:site-specific integrase [bacterium]